MKSGYTIVYVGNAAAPLELFERAFGLARRFLHECGDYGGLETGAATLSFVSHETERTNGVPCQERPSHEGFAPCTP